MPHETRIVTAPNKSWFKSRKWFWSVQRRSYATSYGASSVRVYGIWAEAAHGYARHQPAAEDKALLWLAEEALTKRLAETKQQVAIDRVKKQRQLTTITYIEEN